MRRFLLSLIVLGSFVVGCERNTTEIIAGDGNDNTITISLPATRTSLGEKSGESYPLRWSESDCIAVNGCPSIKIDIDSEDPALARFSFEESHTYPLHITYPYIASTAEKRDAVLFPDEQSYAEGTFAEGSAPMCGYAESEISTISFRHLTTILRLPIKATSESVVLKKVIVTSTSNTAISGIFNVDCSTATITPETDCSNKITYSLPANFALSTTEERTLHISLPAVNVGGCTIEFVASSGEKMDAIWKNEDCLTAGVVREFKEIIFEPNSLTTLQPMTAEEDEFSIFYKNINGYVTYSDGSPIEGVAVSDGFQVVATDAKGYYELTGVTPQTWYIYCSMPADVKMPIDKYGRPCYYKNYPSSSPRYDFSFERLEGGIEDEFVIVAMADTQVATTEYIKRFSAQAAPEIKSYTRSLNLPCYGVVLGDMVADKEALMEGLREALAYDKMGIPVFPCYGNHDHITMGASIPVFADNRNFDYNIKIQRALETHFGPINYSYNRGKAHIISMRDVLYNTNKSSGNYRIAFTDAQLEWLKQDLALVPKDKMVVLCVHIPLINKGALGDGSNIQEVLNLLDEYAEAHILSGHTHYQYPYDHQYHNTGHKIYEHCMAAVRWDMMDSNIHRDGTPCGYTLLFAKGNSFVNWYYKGYPHGMNDRNYQMRLYRGGSIFGADAVADDKYGTTGYYRFPYDSGVLLANIFSSDPSWDVEVYEDGAYSGKMSYHYAISKSEYENLIGDLTYSNPKRVADGVQNSRDWWAIGFLLGHLGSSTDYNYNLCRTMWKYTLKNPDAKSIEVRATDRFGNTYTESKITEDLDIGYALYDPQYNPAQ